MKASELRIGNLVDDNGLVETVTSDHLINDEYYDGLKGCLPIPLTNEWLIKFGFEKIRRSYCLNRSLRYRVIKTNGVYTFRIEYIDSKHLARIDYVHQLQNLYFALTGNELEIKE